jgi:predicted Zn finger-like uncharacterized protein
MAAALECPACGARHRIENLPEDAETFRCGSCGQVLKVPNSVSASSGGPPPPARASGAAAVAPPPRRRSDDAAPVGAAPSAKAVSATVSAVASADGGAAAPRGRGRSARGSAPTKGVAWYWRLIAWIVAVPLGFVMTAWPAYRLDLIKKDDVLDIFVGTGTSRYLRLAVGTLIWALVTALLVQLFVEGGRAWAARRRARATAA